jgi:hypothetical protein
VEDARPLISKLGNPFEIEADDFRITARRIRHPEARYHLVIEKGVITAILAADALAQRASSFGDRSWKARWFRGAWRSSPINMPRLVEILQDADQVLTQPPDAVS